MYEDLRSKMMAFVIKQTMIKIVTRNTMKILMIFFRKDIKQYIDRVHNAYLSRLRTAEFYFNKYNGKYSKETITSSKRAQALYDKIVDYFPNNKYVT
jgi:NADH:ubiquinone oxidoreductase subunit 5 (subunit L)/multisubunit Na+/H+ antiporter MnhA subunit